MTNSMGDAIRIDYDLLEKRMAILEKRNSKISDTVDMLLYNNINSDLDISQLQNNYELFRLCNLIMWVHDFEFVAKDNINLLNRVLDYLKSSDRKKISIVHFDNYRNSLVMGTKEAIEELIKQSVAMDNLKLLTPEELSSVSNLLHRLDVIDIVANGEYDYLTKLLWSNWREIYDIGRSKYDFENILESKLSNIKEISHNNKGIDYTTYTYLNVNQPRGLIDCFSDIVWNLS